MLQHSLHLIKLTLLYLAATISILALPNHSQLRAQEVNPPQASGITKVLFLGNSITLHAPAPQIGWNGNWGMAASAKDKDYVHILIDRMSQATGKKPTVMVKNIADFERQLGAYKIKEQLKEELAFQADIIILAIGENCQSPDSEEARQQFTDAMDRLLAHLHEQGHPTVFVRSQFWPDTNKDTLLKLATEKHKAIWVDLGQMGTDQKNFALSERVIEHAGVGRHPGDQGMQAIANKIWAAIEQHSLKNH